MKRTVLFSIAVALLCLLSLSGCARLVGIQRNTGVHSIVERTIDDDQVRGVLLQRFSSGISDSQTLAIRVFERTTVREVEKRAALERRVYQRYSLLSEFFDFAWFYVVGVASLGLVPIKIVLDEAGVGHPSIAGVYKCRRKLGLQAPGGTTLRGTGAWLSPTHNGVVWCNEEDLFSEVEMVEEAVVGGMTEYGKRAPLADVRMKVACAGDQWERKTNTAGMVLFHVPPALRDAELSLVVPEFDLRTTVRLSAIPVPGPDGQPAGLEVLSR